MKDKKKKNKFAVPVGILTFALAIVGLLTLISLGVGKVRDLRDNTAKKAEYEEFLKPVVMFDPDPFDDLTSSNPAQLLNAAVWELLMSEKGVSGYSYSQGETIGIIVPQADIEEHFINLFGKEIDIASMHSSIDMSVYGISYDSALKSYILPITGIDSAYIPKISSMKKIGDSVVLTVGYIGYRAFADIEGDNYTLPDPDKVMTVTLRERDGQTYISSIQNS